MFDQICNESIREKVLRGEKIPDDHLKRMHMLSKSWSIRPLSYKQFTNLVSKNNQYYEDLVKINAEEVKIIDNDVWDKLLNKIKNPIPDTAEMGICYSCFIL
jgi:hypothetical protein